MTYVNLKREYESICLNHREKLKAGEEPESYYKVKCAKCNEYFQRTYNNSTGYCQKCKR